MVLSLNARKDLSWLSCPISEEKYIALGSHLRPHLTNESYREHSNVSHLKSIFMEIINIGDHLITGYLTFTEV